MQIQFNGDPHAAIEASGVEIVTGAVCRTNIDPDCAESNRLDYLPPERFTILPNTASSHGR